MADIVLVMLPNRLLLTHLMTPICNCMLHSISDIRAILYMYIFVHVVNAHVVVETNFYYFINHGWTDSSATWGTQSRQPCHWWNHTTARSKVAAASSSISYNFCITFFKHRKLIVASALICMLLHTRVGGINFKSFCCNYIRVHRRKIFIEI